MMPVNDKIAALVTAMHSANIQSTMCDGKWLMRDRKILTLDEEVILKEACERAKAIYKRAEIIRKAFQRPDAVGLSECVGPYILAEFPDLLEAFIDFLFSDEAQQLVAEAYLLPGRSDVQCESRTNLSDIPQLPTDWTKMMDVASATAAKLNSLCQ